MFFNLKSSLSNSLPKASLSSDRWDDFGFKTLFSLSVNDEMGYEHWIGGVKIGQFGLLTGNTQIPDQFDKLDESFFSLGQDSEYYEGLKNLNSSLRERILTGLRDVAADLSLFDQALEEKVTKISLLRSVTPVTVRGQFKRLVDGGSRLSHYNFSYQVQNLVGSSIHSIALDFEVKPESNPPTNVHVLIGRNGVGKTRILNYMTRSLVDKNASSNQVGVFTSQEQNNNLEIFANLVSVTFSAFDDFAPLRENEDKTNGIKYSYVGLKPLHKEEKETILSPKTPEQMALEFVDSINSCRQGAKVKLWLRSLEMLEADPIFKEAEVSSLAVDNQNETFEHRSREIFRNLSSGHKIVLLTITRLVETVEERTLVLLDEPEAHLHPPLLSAFVRALSDILVYRNGVAVIATHSPVVLQEVPKSCVWKLRRNGAEAIAERPEIETFGENVGTLTREVFGLEVTQSGFHRLLQSAVDENKTFSQTIQIFDNELGSEARTILRAMIVERDSEEET